MVGRELIRNPELLIVSQPTWGVDAGSANNIHQSLISLADQWFSYFNYFPRFR